VTCALIETHTPVLEKYAAQLQVAEGRAWAAGVRMGV
jgi:hypothetical protein